MLFVLLVLLLSVARQALAQTNLINVTNLALPEWGWASIAISGHYLYAGNGYSLRFIDVADPGNPVDLGDSPSPLACSSITISSNYAYIRTGVAVDILDISQPTNPVVIAQILGNPRDISLSGHYLCLAGSGSTSTIYDMPTQQILFSPASCPLPTA